MFLNLRLALLAVLSIGTIATLPLACEASGVGDPCVLDDEYRPDFAGFTLSQDFLETPSLGCRTRVCLINHMQGRVTCPLGQPAPTPCDPAAAECASGEKCVESAVSAAECTKDSECVSGSCNKAGKFCECDPNDSATCPSGEGWRCEEKSKQCKRFICHVPGNCQNEGDSPKDNEGKDCCVPGTDTPVAVPVCGQCAENAGKSSDRSAASAAYCTCRCPLEGEERVAGVEYCECPDGFSCSQVRKDFGLGDKLLTGGFCVKAGTEYKDDQDCGQVDGYHNDGLDGSARCAGTRSGKFTGKTEKAEDTSADAAQ